MPVCGSQVPATWHWSDAVQTTGAPPTQLPAWQLSPWVQALPSVQAVPFVAAGLEHMPVCGSQVPATWHWSDAVHTTGAPTQVPAWQLSPCVQRSPSLQALPLATAVWTQPLAGSQVSVVQTFPSSQLGGVPA